jgi:hypothetical protein
LELGTWKRNGWIQGYVFVLFVFGTLWDLLLQDLLQMPFQMETNL